MPAIESASGPGEGGVPEEARGEEPGEDDTCLTASETDASETVPEDLKIITSLILFRSKKDVFAFFQ